MKRRFPDHARLETTRQCARRLAITPRTLLQWEKAGRVHAAFKNGRTYRWDFEDVRADLARGSADFGGDPRDSKGQNQDSEDWSNPE